MLKITKTGMPEIDSQHETLIQRMMELHQAIQKKAGRTELEAAMQRLAYYSMTHLAYEEEGMLTLGYPRQQAHLEQHKIFRERMSDIAEKVQSASPNAASELLIFLKEWFLNHIEVEDVQYINYLHGTSALQGSKTAGKV